MWSIWETDIWLLWWKVGLLSVKIDFSANLLRKVFMAFVLLVVNLDGWFELSPINKASRFGSVNNHLGPILPRNDTLAPIYQSHCHRVPLLHEHQSLSHWPERAFQPFHSTSSSLLSCGYSSCGPVKTQKEVIHPLYFHFRRYRHLNWV